MGTDKKKDGAINVPKTSVTTSEQNNSSTPEVSQKPQKRKRVWLWFLVFIVALVLGNILFVCGVGKALGFSHPLGLIRDIIVTPQDGINNYQERINILVLGKSGEGYSAPDLTDTIIFASVGLGDQGVKIFSIPRDIWIPSIRAKINSAYYWGKQKQEGYDLVKSSVEEITGQIVDYVVVVDFGVFVKAVDVVGGVAVEVENSFTDEKYPIVGKENDDCGRDPSFGCRYETVTFEKGTQYMDGETALKFVRSRNAEGDEGTDLAREKRQQRVILALKNKITDPKILLRPKIVIQLWNLVYDSVETDLNQEIISVLARNFIKFRPSLSTGAIPESFLINPPISVKYDNQYVFISSSGSWEELHLWVEEFFN